MNNSTPYNNFTNQITTNSLSYSSNQSFFPPQANFIYPVNTLNFNIPNALSYLPQPQIASSLIQAHMHDMMMISRLKANLQNQLIKTHAFQILEPSNTVCHEKQIRMPPSPTKLQTLQQDIPKAHIFHANPTLPPVCDPNKSVKAHLKDILHFVLNNFKILSDEEIELERLKYRNHQDLMLVFEVLIARYAAVAKSKEEMAKYSFRKALKFMKQKSKKDTKKGVTETSADIYYGNLKVFEEDFPVKIKEESPKENHFLRNQRNEGSCDDYSFGDFSEGFQEYFKNLECILELDNTKKVERFASFIEGLMKKRAIMEIKKYKRIPWLKIWIEKAKQVTSELVQSKSENEFAQSRKIMKKEEDCSKIEEGFDHISVTKMEHNSL